MITEDYVSFETAKLLKERGFNEPCRLYYDKYHGYVPIFVEDSKLTEYGCKELVRNDQNNISDFIASAPSLYVAMKWLREVHGVHVVPKFDFYGGDYTGRIYDGRRETASERDDYIAIAGHKTYNEAADAAIKYCLENLI